MAKRLVISEEQYNMALKEGVNIKADLSATNGDVNKAVDSAKKSASELGLSDNDYDVVVGESKFFTKKELQENRLKALKKNSEFYTMKDFIKQLNKR